VADDDSAWKTWYIVLFFVLFFVPLFVEEITFAKENKENERWQTRIAFRVAKELWLISH
jgi:hypothetical protein